MNQEIKEQYGQINWNDEEWILHPQRGLYWKDRDLLLIADTHFGKIKHFQKSGIPLPGEKETKTYKRLETLLDHFKPGKVAILGDLFHSKYNTSWDQFIRWRAKYAHIEFHLVRGNHDILEEKHYEHIDIMMHEKSWDIEHITLTHQALNDKDKRIQIGGHLHPGVRLQGMGKQKMKLPCFHFSNRTCILPALGFFTGLASIEINKGDRVFVTTGKQVIEI